MMADAEHGLFEMVVVKDISRFARNTVDLLQNVRKLKSLGIEGDYEGIGHCVLGYVDCPQPEAAPRKENYVYYV